MNISALRPRVEPTDKSNSPEIISIVTPTAMMPCDVALVMIEAIERPSRIWAGGQPPPDHVVMMKKIITDKKPTIAPDSADRPNNSRACSI